MLSIRNYMGKITVTDNYTKALICRTVSGCIGVASMKSGSFREYILNDILKRNPNGIGVHISTKENELIVNLHISVTYGTNIAAVVRSIKNKVEFAVYESIGINVRSVNVYVDSIRE